MVPVVASQAMYAVHTEDTNLIACVPPKNSCTLHKSLLQRTRGVRDYESTGNVHGQGSANLRLSSWTSEHIGQAFQNLSMPKYAIIKNPMARTLSGYLSKVEKFAPKDQRTVEDYKKWAYDVFPKGSGRNRDWSRVNPHWRPQSTFCGFRAFNLHEHFHMFRFEQPHTFVDFIYEHIPARYLDSGWGVKLRLNVSFSDYVLSPAVREVRGTKSADKKFEYYRDLDFFDHMAEELRDDIILLGYDDDVRSLREKIVELNEAEKGGKIKAVVRSLMTRYMKFADSFAKHSGIR